MTRWKAALLAAATLLFTLSGTVQATHGGPEHRALGRGERETQPIVAGGCVDFALESIFPRCTAEQLITTTTHERFDFDARIGRRSPDAHGHMSYELSTVTVVTTERTPFGDQHCAAAGEGSLGCTVPESTTETREDLRANADVTCLTVVQNRAAIGGLVTRWEGTTPPSRSILFYVTDNTIARQQVGGPDRFSSRFSDLVLDVCPAPDVDAPITKGDIKVDQS